MTTKIQRLSSEDLLQQVASRLHDEIGQHAIGAQFLASTLADELTKEGSTQIESAKALLDELTTLKSDVLTLIRMVDRGASR